MKKTTWVIIGLSICVVALSTALGVVLLQQKTDTILVRESKDDSSSTISEELRKRIESFNINPRRPNDAVYFNPETYIKYTSEKMGHVLYHNNQVYGVPGVPGKGIKVYRNGNATTYVITKEK